MITDFEIHDAGVMLMDDILGDASANRCKLGDGFECGVGTDAESALDDLLAELSKYHDITGLEGRIKSEWEPSDAEGDSDSDTYYCLMLKFNEDE